MAINTCVVSGNVFSLMNQGLNAVSVKANIIRPFTHADGTLIMSYEVTTTSSVTGAWSLTLIETTTPQVGGIPITVAFEFPSGSSGSYNRKEYTVVVPNTATATFASLIAGQI